MFHTYINIYYSFNQIYLIDNKQDKFYKSLYAHAYDIATYNYT